jgi:hypothetical protein
MTACTNNMKEFTRPNYSRRQNENNQKPFHGTAGKPYDHIQRTEKSKLIFIKSLSFIQHTNEKIKPIFLGFLDSPLVS